MSEIEVVAPGTPGAYTPYGGCAEFLEAKDHQTFIYGSAGSGKSYAACYRLLLLCMLYPGARALLARQSYTALLESAVITFEEVLDSVGWQIGKKPGQIAKAGDKEPDSYTFPYAIRKVIGPDGKPIIYKGRSKIILRSVGKVYDMMGTAFDYIYVTQPEEITEEDWGFLVTRADGRANNVPEPMLWGDPNPQHEGHWIKKWGYINDSEGKPDNPNGRWRLIKSTYHDNPTVWDHSSEDICEYTGITGKFTERGKKQFERKLKSLSSIQKKRLIDAEWVTAEGMVYYDVWDKNKHVITQKQYNELNIDHTWEKYWGIDFGFVDPYVLIQFRKHPNEDLYVCDKFIFMTNRTVVEHAETIRNEFLSDGISPTLVVADRNPQEIMILQQNLGLNIITAKKGAGSIKAGINVITEMLKSNQLLFLEGACVEMDPILIEKKKPIGFIEEVEGYRWDTNKKVTNELPIGIDNHSLDAAAYLFTHIKADQRIIKAVWI